MRRFYFAILLFSSGLSAQIINFPDPNFKAKLIEASPENDIAKDWFNNSITVDVNHDNEISVEEAQLVNYRLDVSYSEITDLTGIKEFHALQYLIADNNQISSADLSNWAAPYLHTISLSHNQLTSINLSGTKLLDLFLDYNYLTGIDLSNLRLSHLGCSNNLFSAIDISVMPADCLVSSLNCSYNPNLTYINIKRSAGEMANIYGYFSFFATPQLEYVCCNEVQLPGVLARFAQYGYTNCEANTYCDFFPGGVYYTLNGAQIFDSDSDGCTAQDVSFPIAKINVASPYFAGSFFSNFQGEFEVNLSQGNYSVTPQFENPGLFNVSPASATVSFPAQGSVVTQNFCISANGNHPDLDVVVVPLGPARPGFITEYELIVQNVGNQPVGGNLQLTYQQDVADLLLSSPVQDAQSLNTLFWTIGTLQPTQSMQIRLRLLLHSPTATPPLNSGDALTFTANVQATADENPDNNQSVVSQMLQNSFDPNDKICVQGNAIGPDMVGQYVHYRIRFENTGTAEATNIVVADVIDPAKFDISSLRPLGGSHPFETRIKDNKVEFIFKSIDLPFDDENNDGYLIFKIKTLPTLVVGDTFQNAASIYFDYNFPIVTEPAVTTIEQLSNPDFDFSSYFTLYPNPAQNQISVVSSQNAAIRYIEIFDALGRIVVSSSETASLDISELKSGTYVVRIISDKGNSSTKFIKK